MKPNSSLHLSWLIRMAWRDSRRNRSRLLLFISSIILGIAALVAIYSLGDNMQQEIDNQAAELIGADLEISGNNRPTPKAQNLFASLGDRRSEERSFVSMALFPKTNGVRLVQVRALEGDFPYYGKLETQPATAHKTFRNARAALVDQSLMLQFGVKVGDSIKLGSLSFAIAGTLLKMPGQTGFSTSVSPPVYIPLHYLDQTGLSQKGSRITYRHYFKYDHKVNIEQVVKKLEPQLEAEGLNYDTIQSQKEDTSRAFKDLADFLALVGFIALLLGCVGVASAIHIYVREKVAAIAILRCLGTSALQAILIYLIQIIGIGLLGSLVGALLGSIIQRFLPTVFQDFLPISLTTQISWSAIGQGIALGLIISVLFALSPLISIRKISPLHTLRLSFEHHSLQKDVLKWMVYGLILLFVIGFTYLQLKNWAETFFFTAGLLTSFLILTAIAVILIWMVRRFFPVSWSYLWRQGLANLQRPNNQTTILLVSIGLGTAFICTLFLVQGILLNRVQLSASGNQPNFVLFDIQPKQKEKVEQLTHSFGLPVLQSVPIVNMRLEAVNGVTDAQLLKDTTLDLPRRIFIREYRVTFRDSLISSEKIVGGKWAGTSKSATIPISLEQNFARRNKIKIGDTMTFNVQGALISTIVGSLREVDWNRIQTNFLVVFPKGVLEEAPQFHVLLTRVQSPQASARFQQAMVRQFPNVSIIDLGLVLNILDEILDKIGFVIRFMAGFSIFTGLVVLIASVLISKYQRMQESVLLRTLGASRKQILVITALEYFFLGALAAATGIVLSLAASWALAHYTFETTFTPQLLPIFVVFIVVCCLTVIIGLTNSRSVFIKPPLEVLRQET
ncbi:ABC transporter permease [Chitinophagaceae bacterium LB-8]|uniref:ABC transporter permease n=1 Tax=Paraflavisolibacter caeni TaxID=2982496 RepID=A0A9X3B7W7_9BACT|nr:FtsX-like permease family protein [Paraflavisolibacter caeni]MCU7548961.1 ABC transporter permease [Paraflavisolibacter caeni]